MHFSKAIVAVIHDISGKAMHWKRVDSLAHAVVGTTTASQAGVASIGRAAGRPAG